LSARNATGKVGQNGKERGGWKGRGENGSWRGQKWAELEEGIGQLERGENAPAILQAGSA